MYYYSVFNLTSRPMPKRNVQNSIPHHTYQTTSSDSTKFKTLHVIHNLPNDLISQRIPILWISSGGNLTRQAILSSTAFTPVPASINTLAIVGSDQTPTAPFHSGLVLRLDCQPVTEKQNHLISCMNQYYALVATYVIVQNELKSPQKVWNIF